MTASDKCTPDSIYSSNAQQPVINFSRGTTMANGGSAASAGPNGPSSSPSLGSTSPPTGQAQDSHQDGGRNLDSKTLQAALTVYDMQFVNFTDAKVLELARIIGIPVDGNQDFSEIRFEVYTTIYQTYRAALRHYG
jgi:hypothetical protein